MLNYKENALLGLEGLRTHKFRAMLSMLGIIFGVGAVIAMLSIGEGAKQQALEQIQLLGINNIIVEDTRNAAQMQQEDDSKKKTGFSLGLSWADARAIEELNPLVEMTAPVCEASYTVRYRKERVTATIVGTTPEYINVLNYVPTEGSFFNYQDVDTSARVCVLGNGVRRKLFLYRNPIGEKVKIRNQWFTVIGVMQDKAISSARKSDVPVQDLNSELYIPITTSKKRFPIIPTESEIKRFISRVSDVNRIQEASNILKKTMDRRHEGVEDFSITVPEALLRQSMQTQRIFNIVMGAIAGISLLVGGIGIMNIMMASVLERTREIGIRRATGACRKDVLMQFLLESVFLSFAGGIIGILLGFGLTQAIAMYANWRTIVSIQAVLLSFCVSVGIGIIFGVYPAKRAAKMNPIEALRYE